MIRSVINHPNYNSANRDSIIQFKTPLRFLNNPDISANILKLPIAQSLLPWSNKYLTAPPLYLANLWFPAVPNH